MGNIKTIILAGGSATRLFPITLGVSKQLLPIYDKPCIHYPISVAMLAGSKDILIITNPENVESFKRLLGDGSDLGVNFSYAAQEKPRGIAEAFLVAENCGFLKEGEPVSLILGDNIFHSTGLTSKLKAAAKMAKYGRASVFGFYVQDARRYGVAVVDKNTKLGSGFYPCVDIEEKPEHPKSNYAVVGLYFYPGTVLEKVKQLKPSKRGELEITDLNDAYIKDGNNRLGIHLLSRGTVWFDSGTFDSLLEASNYVQAVQKRTGCEIACLPEIAFNNGWIGREKLREYAGKVEKTEHAAYLEKIYQCSCSSVDDDDE